MRGFEKAEKK